MDQLKTFEDACKIEGLNYEQVTKLITEWMAMILVMPNLTDKSVEAYVKLMIIVRAANRLSNDGEAWLPNWKNPSEYKYYPYFDLSGPSGFRFYGCVGWRSVSDVGSRLCFKKYSDAEYVANQFIDLYREFMVIEEKPVIKFSERLSNLKVRMYQDLLAKKNEELTTDEADLIAILSRDPAIQEVLDRKE